MKKENFLEKVLTARVYDLAKETPLDYLDRISDRFDNKVWLKREDLQPVFSFKLRGAFNKIYQMHRANPDLSGVITASAGADTNNRSRSHIFECRLCGQFLFFIGRHGQDTFKCLERHLSDCAVKCLVAIAAVRLIKKFRPLSQMSASLLLRVDAIMIMGS